jgi:hypothetical protein
MTLTEQLIAAAEAVKKIDDKITNLSNFIDYKEALSVSIITFGINGNWSGISEIIGQAVNQQVKLDIEALKNEKAALLMGLDNQIVDAVRDLAPDEGPLV